MSQGKRGRHQWRLRGARGVHRRLAFVAGALLSLGVVLTSIPSAGGALAADPASLETAIAIHGDSISANELGGTRNGMIPRANFGTDPRRDFSVDEFRLPPVSPAARLARRYSGPSRPGPTRLLRYPTPGLLLASSGGVCSRIEPQQANGFQASLRNQSLLTGPKLFYWTHHAIDIS